MTGENNHSFIEFLDSIPIRSLPLQFDCGLPDDVSSTAKFEKFTRYIPKSVDRIVGRIKSSGDNYKLIIFGQTGDDIYPVLFSFDNNGNVKDSLSLMLSGCGRSDKHQIPNASVSINSDITITMTDTIRFIHYPENLPSVEVYVVDSVNVSRVVVKVGQNGNFIREE